MHSSYYQTLREIDLTTLLVSRIEQFISSNAPEVSKKVLMEPAGLELVHGTGNWLFQDQKFKEWLQSRDGRLWIKGARELCPTPHTVRNLTSSCAAGCGKTGLA